MKTRNQDTAQVRELQKRLLGAFAMALLALFTIPVGALLFIDHLQDARSDAYYERAWLAIDRNPSLSPDERVKERAQLRSDLLKTLCGNDDPQHRNLRLDVCSHYSLDWQLHAGRQIAWGTLALSVIAILSSILLGAAAFTNPDRQYASFLAGWHLLRAIAAIEVILQGGLLIWLSYWLPAVFWNVNPGRVVVYASLIVGGLAVRAIWGIFSKPQDDHSVEGELIAAADAPAFFAHIREMAAKLGTQPPQHVIAGIDANFFVTESPMQVGATTLTGRSLYVSIPLLRLLSKGEANAVLAHELAHFSGGDTARSAALAPKLVEFDHYSYLLWHSGSTRAVYYAFHFFRFVFELALRRESRQREFLADRIAARNVSSHALVGSLIKIAAYASYRSQVEDQLFARDRLDKEQLGIAARVMEGLNEYAGSAQFIEMMRTANVPHPFDSHPPLQDRMLNVGIRVDERHFGAVVRHAATSTWVSEIATAESVERRLWSKREEEFAGAHELSRAYRVDPTSDEERETVEKHFPPVEFELRRGRTLTVTYEGIERPNGSGMVPWDNIADMEYHNGFMADVLILVLREKRFMRAKRVKMRLFGIAKRRDELKATLGRYWERHEYMRSQRNEASQASTQSPEQGP